MQHAHWNPADEWQYCVYTCVRGNTQHVGLPCEKWTAHWLLLWEVILRARIEICEYPTGIASITVMEKRNEIEKWLKFRTLPYFHLQSVRCVYKYNMCSWALAPAIALKSPLRHMSFWEYLFTRKKMLHISPSECSTAQFCSDELSNSTLL